MRIMEMSEEQSKAEIAKTKSLLAQKQRELKEYLESGQMEWMTYANGLTITSEDRMNDEISKLKKDLITPRVTLEIRQNKD